MQWPLIISCRRHNMQWPSLRNKFGWMGTLQAPQQFNGKVVVEVQGARHLEAPKNLHLMVPKSRSIIAQQYVDGYAFLLGRVALSSMAMQVAEMCVVYLVDSGIFLPWDSNNAILRTFRQTRQQVRTFPQTRPQVIPSWTETNEKNGKRRHANGTLWSSCSRGDKFECSG